MFKTALFSIALLSIFNYNYLAFSGLAPQEQVLAQQQISLEQRVPGDTFGNEGFKDNILLNLAYMRGLIHSSSDIKWEDIRKPFEYEMELAPGETFAFHEDVLPEYQGKISKTTNAHFNNSEGFKTVYGLAGNGVCHLASLMYWTSQDAYLEAKAPTNHDFALIPEIDKKYGVAIYNSSRRINEKNLFFEYNHPQSSETGARQNLYITNNKETPIKFRFEYDGTLLKLKIIDTSGQKLRIS